MTADPVWGSPVAQDPPRILLTLSPGVVVSVLLISVFALLGARHVYLLITWRLSRQCLCPKCMGEYDIIQHIGAGGFGRVYKVKEVPWEAVSGFGLSSTAASEDGTGAASNSTDGVHTPGDIAAESEYLVLKEIRTADLNEASEAQAECRQLRTLQHPHIVKLRDDWLHYEWNNLTQTVSVCLVMEYCATDVAHLITRASERDVAIPEPTIARWGLQLAEALAYCHAKGVVHMDVNSHNVFLTQRGDIKLGDFNLARSDLVHGKALRSFTEVGTDGYKSVETVRGGARDARAADVFGLGIMLHELATGTKVYERDRPALAIDMLERGQTALNEFLDLIPGAKHGKGYSPGLKRVIRECLAVEPKQRVSAAKLKHTQYLRKMAAQAPRAGPGGVDLDALLGIESGASSCCSGSTRSHSSGASCGSASEGTDDEG